MDKLLYLECKSGISGDMTVGALLDLGADQQVLRKALASLPLTGYTVEISRVKKAGLDCCDFLVKLDAEHENHDHDMDYLYGFAKNQAEIPEGEGRQHGHHVHHHDHGHLENGGEPHHHHHAHRGLKEVLDILAQGDLTEGAHALAVKIFTILGEAEAKAHGTTLEEVHFHEVGAVDSIVDIAAVAVCLDNLGIREVVIPVLNEGTGSVRCAHGILPIPVPAVANIAAAHHLPLHIMPFAGEYVTPTGAAIAAALRTRSQLPDTFTVAKVGLGAGKREQAMPSLLRSMLLEVPEEPVPAPWEEDTIWKLETDLDDCTGEALGHVLEHLLASGARDVQYAPVYMKKNRPGWLVTVLCKEPERQALEALLFAETTTIGIRRSRMVRSILERKEQVAETSLGPVAVKAVQVPALDADGKMTGETETRLYPEYVGIAALCRSTGRSYQAIWQQVLGELAAAGKKEG
ncbi:nickel pincer cofactor biosynthesis protein LarC [Acidaminococcus massiliensis]|uniref:nickel pincer cofactor biosynthesis protein LarC n=1 Tax=Acidaminococcus massiliensis TaxID=1852375 RepID=UPI0022E86BAC|nr:nickel pincer cofactor biosynthesis protein LarC [Acidaminococcus massiliensis]